MFKYMNKMTYIMTDKKGYQESNWTNINGPIENFIVEHDSVEYENFNGWN